MCRSDNCVQLWPTWLRVVTTTSTNRHSNRIPRRRVRLRYSVGQRRRHQRPCTTVLPGEIPVSCLGEQPAQYLCTAGVTHFHYLPSSLSPSITPSTFHSRLKSHLFWNPFLHSLSDFFQTAFTDLNLYWTKWALAFVCFSFFFHVFGFWLRLLDKADHTQLLSPR